MEKEKALQRAKELKELIYKYDVLYYEKGISEISDAEYDRLYDEYLQLENELPELRDKEDAPTKRVGAGKKDSGTSTTLPKFTHKSPLLSIDKKSKNLEDLKDFYDKCGGDGTEVIVEPKLDGITCNINYENGVFVNAATRGNGYVGDLITENFKHTVTKYPKELPNNNEYLELRGEAIIPYDFFKENLTEDYSNPRNAVAGIMRQITPSEVTGKGVQVMFYDLGATKNLKTSQYDGVNVEMIKALGFGSVPVLTANNWEQLREIVETKMRGAIKNIDGFNVLVATPNECDNCEYPQAVCDGLVIKVNDLKLREEIGMSSKGPKWAMAYKFKPLQAETRIDHVEWQVGKTGKITPVAVFDKVSLGGVEITKATLNNYDYMSNLPYGDIEAHDAETVSLNANDIIIIERSNDVIPRIVGVKELAINPNMIMSKKKREDVLSRAKAFLAPTVCPVCGKVVEQRGPLHYCTNPWCGAKLKGVVQHYASRNALNITGLGESVVDFLFENGYIHDTADLYLLEQYRNDLVKHDGFGKRKVDNLLKEIEKSRSVELDRFIYGLSIPNVGRKTSKDLAMKFHSFKAFMECDKEELLSIEDIGETVAEDILNYFQDLGNQNLIGRLLDKVNIKDIELAGDKFKGLSFVITGTLQHPRSYYQEIIEKNGGKVSGSVSKKTNVVLIGSDAGSKEAKARKLVSDGANILILDEEKEILNYLS